MALGAPSGPTSETPTIVIYAPREQSGVSFSRRKWRMAFVGGCIGAVCCALALASVLRDGGYVGSNGRAAAEPVDLLAMFKAPEVQLAGVPNALSRGHSNQDSFRALSSKVIQLDSVKPLLDGSGVQNVAEAVNALQRSGGSKSTLTLRGVPTEVTITLPEDVTISRAAALSGDGATTKLDEGVGLDFWAYDGPVMPPKDWGNEWKLCRVGTNGKGKDQSPIDIAPATVKGDSALPKIEWKCGGKPCTGDGNASTPSPSKVDILYDGHTLQMSNFDADGSPSLKWGDADYKLTKIQVHTPSEHTIDEMYYDMELQLEHTGPAGKQLVVAVLFSTGEGIVSPGWVQDIVSVVRPCHLSSDPALCQLSDAPKHLTSAWSFKALSIFLEPLLVRYYTYTGSLTQPPCTEDITWVIATAAGKMSQTDWTNVAALEGKNNRPRQKILGRVINLKP